MSAYWLCWTQTCTFGIGLHLCGSSSSVISKLDALYRAEVTMCLPGPWQAAQLVWYLQYPMWAKIKQGRRQAYSLPLSLWNKKQACRFLLSLPSSTCSTDATLEGWLCPEGLPHEGVKTGCPCQQGEATISEIIVAEPNLRFLTDSVLCSLKQIAAQLKTLLQPGSQKQPHLWCQWNLSIFGCLDGSGLFPTFFLLCSHPPWIS